MLLEGDSPVIQKLNSIHEVGTAALRAGSVEPFTGYPESLKNRFGVCLRYDGSSEQLVRQVVLDEVTRIGQILGIGFFIAGRPAPVGYPIHTTLLEGLYEGDDTHSRSLVFGEHYLRDRMDRGGLADTAINLVPTLKDRLNSSRVPNREWKLKFNAILVDKGPVLLAATEIPQEIVDIRGELAEEYNRVGLRPLPLDNLLHITLTRMTKVINSALADEYIDRMVLLHLIVAENPLVVSVRGLTRRNALDMLYEA